MATYPFELEFIERVRRSCAGFMRRPLGDAGALRKAAVGIVLVEVQDGSGETGFLLTQRATTLRSHAGQFALPGGHMDPGETAIATVSRECAEELALTLAESNVLVVLDDYGTRSGYAITPVALWGGPAQNVVANRDEVSAVHPSRPPHRIAPVDPDRRRRTCRDRGKREASRAPVAQWDPHPCPDRGNALSVRGADRRSHNSGRRS